MAIVISNGNSLLGSYESSIDEPTGVPTPSTQSGIEWWFDAAEKNIDKTIGQLSSLEAAGVEWANWLFELICKECFS